MPSSTRLKIAGGYWEHWAKLAQTRFAEIGSQGTADTDHLSHLAHWERAWTHNRVADGDAGCIPREDVLTVVLAGKMCWSSLSESEWWIARS